MSCRFGVTLQTIKPKPQDILTDEFNKNYTHWIPHAPHGYLRERMVGTD